MYRCFFLIAAAVASCAAVPLQVQAPQEVRAGNVHERGAENSVGSSQSSKFDIELASIFVNFSRTTYCDHDVRQNWTCKTCQALGEFRMYFNSNESRRHVGVYVGYHATRNMAVVAFRGTTYLANWIEDLHYSKMDSNYTECENATDSAKPTSNPKDALGDPGGGGVGLQRKTRKCKVHSGFYNDFNAVRDDVANAVAQVLRDFPDADMWVTGHSLGGALAALCALNLRVTMLSDRPVGLYTFGEPRIGNPDFADFFDETLPNAIRVVHQDDVVPHLPPRGREVLLLTDFHHHNTEVWQSGAEDDDFHVCDGSGEDPNCSNSLPRWDRSVEAHRFYIHWHMHCEA